MRPTVPDELADAVECSKEHVRTTPNDLEDDEVIAVRERAGEHGAHLYRALAGIDAAEYGSTDPDLTPEYTETTNVTYVVYIRGRWR